MIHEVKVGRACGVALQLTNAALVQRNMQIVLMDSALVSKSNLYNWEVAVNKELRFQVDGQKSLTKIERNEKNRWKIATFGIGLVWLLTLLFQP